MVKIITKFLLGLGFAAATPVTSSAQELWKGVQYGMSEKDVVKIFPQAHHYTETMIDIHNISKTINYDFFGWKGLKLDNCSMTVNFNFSKRKLVSVQLSTDDISKHNLGCTMSIKEGLYEKYSKPNIIRTSNIFRTYIWDEKNNLRIAMLISSFPSTHTWNTTVAYSIKPKSNAESIL
ncbi:hypothetical protein [Acetobacter sp. KSO5]|uniref:hypothetical protein n=1 Tax=Acetobacter sp. KSO5 TaxID=3373674 RepID=UPI00376EBDD1